MFVQIFSIAGATAAILFFCCSSSQQIDYVALNYDPTSLTAVPPSLVNLKGHIRSYTQYFYPPSVDAKGAMHRGKLERSNTILFTREGLVTENWLYTTKDSVTCKTWYRNRRLSQIDSMVHFSAGSAVLARNVSYYNRDGIVVGGYLEYENSCSDDVSNIETSGDTLIVTERDRVKYYVNGHCVKWYNGNSCWKFQYQYFPSGALRRRVTNENGHVLWDERFDEEGQRVYWLTNKFQDNRLIRSREESSTYRGGLRMQKIEKHVDGPDTWTDTYTYEYRNRLPIRSFQNGLPYGFCEYNEHNDLLREKFDSFDEGYRYSAYDSEGNWTERIQLIDSKPFQVEVRKFEYY